MLEDQASDAVFPTLKSKAHLSSYTLIVWPALRLVDRLSSASVVCSQTYCRHIGHCFYLPVYEVFQQSLTETDLQILAKNGISSGVAMQVRVDWPSAEVAGRVTPTVAQTRPRRHRNG